MVNDGILLKLSISNISIFFETKNHSFTYFLIKSRIHTTKQHKNFNNFLKIIDR